MQDIDRCICIPVMMDAAFTTCPFPDRKILGFRIDTSTYVVIHTFNMSKCSIRHSFHGLKARGFSGGLKL